MQNVSTIASNTIVICFCTSNVANNVFFIWFHFRIHKLKESGLLDIYWLRWKARARTDCLVSTIVEPIPLQTLISIFSFLGFVMIASVVICVIEKVSFTNQKHDPDESQFFKNRDVWKLWNKFYQKTDSIVISSSDHFGKLF